ncbi:MAG TPA: potassium transporter Kup [Planctomycetota bacterium]|nr:potassium transporter Kup [Planctomycetota bacterium]
MEDRKPRGRRLAILSLAALGVVYGDIGTSPLYAVRECFHGEYSVRATHDHVLGVLSLMFWSLMLIVSTKYLTFVLRADNRGQGGIVALLALITPTKRKKEWHRGLLLMLGLFGASLLYGDGMITPAISVLSAVEGLDAAAPGLDPYVIPITIVILVGLFLFQSHGTGKVGVVFGPVMIVWFLILAALGVRGVARDPAVFAALSPHHGARFLLHGGWRAFHVLGSVFLVVTGAEALYADLGHFGARPIRVAWFALAFPCLLLNYFGQGALVLNDPKASEHPFYSLAPTWAIYPLVGLATVATIIASQAVISGAFSLTRQLIQLGYCPRLEIDHTSEEEIGQIYVPRVNWALMAATIALVIGFGSSSKLAAAYGVAVTTTMVIATVLFYVVAREKWNWRRRYLVPLAAVFLAVDLTFFGANIGKITHGAWFPLVIALAIYGILSTWKRGRAVQAARMRERAQPLAEFIAGVAKKPPLRVPGRAVFMSSTGGLVPAALLHNLKHNKVLHEEVVILTVLNEEIPGIPDRERVEVEDLGHGFWRIRARYGFMEDPDVPRVLQAAKAKGLEFTLRETSFFLGRQSLLAAGKSGMWRWRERLFALLSHNAQGATAFFRVPPNQVVELGEQVSL